MKELLRKSGRSLAAGLMLVGILGVAGCNGDDDDDGPPVPSEPALREREDRATENAQAWLATFLDEPVGIPDENYFVPSFNLDGWDRSQYLSLFWDADDAAEVDGGVELVYGSQDTLVSVYDVYVNDSVSPPDLSQPVITEFYLQGQTFDGETPFSDYESLTGLFQLEDTSGLFSFTAPAAWWEYEVLSQPPEDYHYVVKQILLNSIQAYVGDPQPTLRLSKIQADPQATIQVDVDLAPYGTVRNLPVVVRVTIKLFLEESPADQATLGLPDVGAVQELAVTPPTTPRVSQTLVVPDIPSGNYSLVIRVETFLQDIYATDGVVIPVEVF